MSSLRRLRSGCRAALFRAMPSRGFFSSAPWRSKEVKYITAPIFYVNAQPHIGHLYTSVMADVMKRWYQLKGFETLYSVGTDEHGLKIQQAAQGAGKSPQLFCDEISEEFKKLFHRAKVEPTDYIRTSEDRHYAAVTALWKRLQDGGWIYKGYHEGWYSVSDETFVPESQIEERWTNGSPQMTRQYSKESGKVVEWTREENYKFKLSAFQRPLIEWLEANDETIVPPHHHRDILAQLKEGELQDLSISRLKSRVSWGIPVPGDPDHVIYVWLDALTNYLTVTGFPWKQEMPLAWPASWHIVGKDIIKFHAIYWPAFLMAANLPLPKRILSHGHWLVSNQKMSKSSGNGVDPYQLLDKYGVDAVRYFLLRDGGIAIDPEFSLETVMRRYKHDLAGHLGNLTMRSTSKKINPTGMVPDSYRSDLTNEDEQSILAMCGQLGATVDGYVEKGQFAEALSHITKLVAAINRYWSIVEPWHFKPDETDKLQNVLYVSFEGIRIAAILLQPVMPAAASSVLDTLQVPLEERTYSHANLGKCSIRDRRVVPAKPLFPPIK
ncbi:methionyl-tRNA synthetase [Kappamyces sp. JEL0829]|nr:methionyl-tRNA synthetase [Kappamyces sp. JEL0829]